MSISHYANEQRQKKYATTHRFLNPLPLPSKLRINKHRQHKRTDPITSPVARDDGLASSLETRGGGYGVK